MGQKQINFIETGRGISGRYTEKEARTKMQKQNNGVENTVSLVTHASRKTGRKDDFSDNDSDFLNEENMKLEPGKKTHQKKGYEKIVNLIV